MKIFAVNFGRQFFTTIRVERYRSTRFVSGTFQHFRLEVTTTRSLFGRPRTIVITHDVRTMCEELADILHSGQSSPGVMVLCAGQSLSSIVSYLELCAYAGHSIDYADAVTFIP